jgi:5-methyltetrahydropteroyltriglutamate--homocysteine methyltransferase
MMWAKEEGVPIDRAALEVRIRSAVAEIVALQRDAGVDIVSDGEVSKPSYATYVKERLSGFGGATKPLALRDLLDYPSFAARHAAGGGPQRHARPACNAPIGLRDRSGIDADVANMKAAVAAARVPAASGFLSAASPGVIALFFANQHYAGDEAYLAAIADAMRPEYEAIAGAGFTLQLDCPDLAMGRHIQFADLDLAGFRKAAALRVEALNFATRNIPPERMRIHLCWGNYEGPHHHDVAIADILEVVFRARPAGISFEAANPRHAHEWRVFETVKLPDGKVLIPGVLESKSNFIEHPELIAQRIGRYAKLVGRENVIAGSDCGFSTFVDTARIDRGIVWAKLKSMAEGARMATEEFWGTG